MSLGDRTFWKAVLLLSSREPARQEQGRAQLIQAGDQESIQAQFYLGECYLRGQDGFAKNERKAVSWFRLAAERGDMPAMINLGTCYLLGTGVAKDRKKARALLEAAVAQSGTYVPPVPPEWFFVERQNLEKAGSGAATSREAPPAMNSQATPWEILIARGRYALGMIHDDEGDAVGALKLYEESAFWGEGGRAGVYESALRAARCHALGRGCTRDLKRANELLARSRELAHASSMAGLHSMWTNRQVDDFLLADLAKLSGSLADAQLATEQQNLTATLLKESPAEARRWCEMSAGLGEAWAMLELGEILRLGRSGVPDAESAFGWYAKAADDGRSWVAIANLVVCHKRGIGTAADEAAAARLVAKYGADNYACALAGAGLAPPQAWSAGDWWALLEHKAKVEKLPLAVFHRSRMRFLEILGGQVATGDLPKAQKETMAGMKRAANGGIAAAHFYLGQMYFRYWPGTPRPARPSSEFAAGAALGDLPSMIELSLIEARQNNAAGYRRAIELSREVLARDPDNGYAHNNLAIWLENMATLGLAVDGFTDLHAAVIEHLERAEELGLALAAKNLAQRYYSGRNIQQDWRMAYSYFQSAAEKGDMESNRMLGKMHEKGEGVPVTLREAVYYYRLAALDGDIESLRRVCDCYLNGRGVERDLEAAKVWLWRLWQTGDADAVVRFGDVLMQQGDYVAARRLWLDLAKSWNQRLASAANYRLASIYHRGLGVKPDTRKADKYSKLAMDFNNPKEVCGRSRNLIAAGQAEEAVVLLEACIDPTGESLCILGSIRITGQGVRKDVETGVTNLRAAAKMGHLEAKYLLAYATVQKIPGAPDLDEADRLLDEAEAGGHPKARELRSKLDRMRTSAREEVPATPVPDEDDRAHPG